MSCTKIKDTYSNVSIMIHVDLIHDCGHVFLRNIVSVHGSIRA